jgi:myo-inositol-1(or 4)-monophosphatase
MTSRRVRDAPENTRALPAGGETDELVASCLDDVHQLIVDLLPRVLDQRYSIRYKEDTSPVTAADLLIEQEVGDLLARSLPGVTVLGEESAPVTWTAEGYVAVLDPIDGTENFCSGLPEWGISLGIWRSGDHVASMLLLPELGRSLKSGDRVEPIQSRITGFSSSYSPAIATGIAEAGEYRVTGCAVYNIYNVIRGSFRRFVNPKGAYIWDLLPGAMLALEHGCTVLVDEEPYGGELLRADTPHRIEILH